MIWPTATMGEVAVIERNGVDPSQIPLGTKYLGLENIDRGGAINGWQIIGETQVASTKFRFSDRHVLFGKLRPNLGKVARPWFDGVCSTDILPIAPGPGLDRDYLGHFLAQPSMVDFAASRAAGANLPRLSPSSLAQFEVPLPPIDEQRRIAAILDQADALRTKRRQTLAHLDDLTQSIFLDMFGDPRRNNCGLPVRRLRDIAEIGTGSTPSRSDMDNYGGHIPWVKTGEVNGGVISQTQEHLTAAGMRSSRCRVFPSGSILIAMYGQGRTRGHVATLGIAATTNQACAVLVPNPEYDSDFLFAQLSVAYEQLRAMGRGGNQPNLNLQLIGEFRVLVPGLAPQQDFAEQVRHIDGSKAAHTSHLVQLDGLFNSLQSRAFSGRL